MCVIKYTGDDIPIRLARYRGGADPGGRQEKAVAGACRRAGRRAEHDPGENGVDGFFSSNSFPREKQNQHANYIYFIP